MNVVIIVHTPLGGHRSADQDLCPLSVAMVTRVDGAGDHGLQHRQQLGHPLALLHGRQLTLLVGCLGHSCHYLGYQLT